MFEFRRKKELYGYMSFSRLIVLFAVVSPELMIYLGLNRIAVLSCSLSISPKIFHAVLEWIGGRLAYSRTLSPSPSA